MIHTLGSYCLPHTTDLEAASALETQLNHHFPDT